MSELDSLLTDTMWKNLVIRWGKAWVVNSVHRSTPPSITMNVAWKYLFNEKWKGSDDDVHMWKTWGATCIRDSVHHHVYSFVYLQDNCMWTEKFYLYFPSPVLLIFITSVSTQTHWNLMDHDKEALRPHQRRPVGFESLNSCEFPSHSRNMHSLWA